MRSSDMYISPWLWFRWMEWWGQGLEMFHNPDALHPVDPLLFSDIVHHHLKGNLVVTDDPAFQIFNSMTFNITLSGDSAGREFAASLG